MLKAGLAAFALALVISFVFEPRLRLLVTSAAELFGVVSLFSLVRLSEGLDWKGGHLFPAWGGSRAFGLWGPSRAWREFSLTGPGLDGPLAHEA